MIAIDELEQDYEDEVIDLERSYTLDEFLELPFDEDYYYELLIGGRILATSRNPGPNKPHGAAAIRISTLLFNYVDADPDRGSVWAETAVKLVKTGSYIKPDVVYLPAANLLADEDPRGPITGLPGLVVEVISPTDTDKIIDDKINTYLEANIPLIWLVYPLRRYVEVWKPGAIKPEIYGLGDSLSLAPVLPDFSLSCDAIFARYQVKVTSDK